MKAKHIIKITIPCQSAEEMLKAKEAVLYHLETLNPEFTAEEKHTHSVSSVA